MSSSIGDCWKVTIHQWRRGAVGQEVEQMPDATAYAIAPSCSIAAEIIEAAFATKHGPLTRVAAVEFAGPAWSEGEATNE